MWFRKNTIEERQEIDEKKYSIEIGHSKSGSAHILVIKSLKIKGDEVEEMMALDGESRIPLSCNIAGIIEQK